MSLLSFGFKRNAPSSSTSSCDSSPEHSQGKSRSVKPTLKKLRSGSLDSVSEEEKAMEEISKKLDELATRKDLETLTTVFMEKVEKLEGRIFQLETEKDILRSDMDKMQKENSDLKQQLEVVKKNNEKHFNDTEQYSRRWNVRVFGVKEGRGDEDCVAQVLKIFNEKVGVKTTDEDIQVAHRVPGGRLREEGGQQNRQRPRAIIVQFASRRVRDKIIRDRKKLARTGLTIAEDLTYKNFKLLEACQKHSATINAWSINGKIIALLKNGKKVSPTIDTDIDAFFNRHLGAS